MQCHMRAALFATTMSACVGLVGTEAAVAQPVAPMTTVIPNVGMSGDPPAPEVTSTISGYVLRTQSAGLFETVEYDPNSCTFEDDPKITTPTAPVHGSVTTTIENLPVAAGQPCAGDVFPTDLVAYEWTDTKPTGTVDKFSVTVTPNIQPASTYNFAITLGPVIKGGTTVWWFNGETPANYNNTLTLYAYPTNLPSYTWTVTAGANHLAFSKGAATFTSSSNQATLTSLGASPPATRDVKVIVEPTGKSSQKSKTYPYLVSAPYKSSPVSYSCKAYSDPTVSGSVGYLCETIDSLADQNGNVLDDGDLEVSEMFTSSQTADSGVTENWPISTACNNGGGGSCQSFPPSGITDSQGFAALPNGSYVPKPTAPQQPLGMSGVLSFNGFFSAGSTTPGKGVEYETLTFHDYTDHADHENVVTPVQ